MKKAVCLAIIVGAIMYSTHAQNSKTDLTIQLALDKADKLFNEGKILEAKDIYLRNIGAVTRSQKVKLAISLVKCTYTSNKLALETLDQEYKNGNDTVGPYLGYLLQENKDLKDREPEGEKLLQEGMTKNQTMAFYYQGVLFDHKKSYAKALSLFEKAAALGCAEAMNNIGTYYKEGYAGSVDKKNAVVWYCKSAALGNPVAYANIGSCYYWGEGTKVNYDSAFTYFSKADEYGNHLYTQYLGLANCYRLGRGVVRNTDSALYYYRKAATKGKSRGYTYIGDIYRGVTYPTSIYGDSVLHYYALGMKKSDFLAFTQAGELFIEGKLVAKNDTLAFQPFKKAAELEDDAISDYAALFRNGIGTEKNLDSCIAILSVPKLDKNVFALYVLADIEDSLNHEDKAVSLFTKAAEAGSGSAMFRLARLYQRKTGDEYKQLYGTWLDRAVESGHSGAMPVLALEYSMGKDRPLDSAKAAFYMMQAAKQGNVDAVDYVTIFAPKYGWPNQNMITPKTDEQTMRDYSEDYSPPDSRISRQALDGNSYSQYLLGLKYLRGIGAGRDTAQAVKWFQQAASAGLPNAYQKLGYMYENGIGFPKNYYEAKSWYELAREKKFPASYTSLGKLYLRGNGVQKDINKALSYFMEAIALGDDEGKTSLAHYYFYNNGSPREITYALQLLKDAAANHHNAAYVGLGVAYLNGKGVPINMDSARFYLTEAAKDDNPVAITELARMSLATLPTTFNTEARDLFLRSAKLGNPTAVAILSDLFNVNNAVSQSTQQKMFVELTRKGQDLDTAEKRNLMIFYKNGIGTEPDLEKAMSLAVELLREGAIDEEYIGRTYLLKKKYTEAIQWYLKSAGKGNLYSSLTLGVIYFSSLEMKNDTLAFKYLKEAIPLNDTIGLETLGLCYLWGVGVTKNKLEAINYLTQAAESGKRSAQHRIGNLYLFSENKEIDGPKAFFWLEKAAMAGIPEALNDFGECYYLGLGTPKDFKKAAYYYQKSVDKNCAIAKLSLGVLYQKGEGVEKDIVKAGSLFDAACQQGIEQGCEEFKKLKD
jgi:uncharacterized protein